MKKIVKLPSLSRVVAGSKATLELPLGNTYERIIFTASSAAGFDAGDIKRIDVLINGNVVQTYKNLQRLIDLNGYYNRDADTMAATGSQFALHFTRAELLDGVWRKAPGFGTADVQTMHIEIEIDSLAPADLAITAHAQVNPARENLGAFFKIREFPVSNATAGVLEADKLPRGAWYAAIHCFKSDITAIEVVANDVKIVEATKAILERLQKGSSPMKRVPVTASCTHIDLITDGNLLDSLPTAGLSDFRVKMTLATAGAVDIVTETVDTISA